MQMSSARNGKKAQSLIAAAYSEENASDDENSRGPAAFVVVLGKHRDRTEKDEED
jgi:hypothetical protein